MSNDLNLIPPPDLEKKKAANRKALWSGIIIAALLLVGYFGVFTPLEAKAKLKRELDANLVDEDQYQALVQEHHELAEELNAATARLNGLAGNLPEAFGWTSLMRDVEEVMPEQVYLKTMEYKERGLYVLGLYKENVDLSRLLVKMRGLDLIESARLLSITYNREEEGWEFEMQCDLPASVYPQEPDGAAGTDGGEEVPADGGAGDEEAGS